jgi:hypothetical protein
MALNEPLCLVKIAQRQYSNRIAALVTLNFLKNIDDIPDIEFNY